VLPDDRTVRSIGARDATARNHVSRSPPIQMRGGAGYNPLVRATLPDSLYFGRLKGIP
jgi:hypothetical protein